MVEIVVGKKLGMIFKTVGFGYLPYNPAGVSYGKTVFRNVSCDDASGADNTALSDCYSRTHRDVSGNPAVVADCNGSAVFTLGHSSHFFVEIRISVLVTEGMKGSEQRSAGTHKHVVSYCHGADVENGQIEVRIASVAEHGVYAEVKVNRPLKINALAAVGLPASAGH